MNTKILVATDFSSRADRAIDRALALCARTGKALRLVHALDFMDAENADWASLDKRMRECVGDTECDVEFAYPEGSPPHAIASASKADDVELLVVGPARYNSLGDFFLGTAVDYVLRNTKKPVLVVKQRPRSSYRHIIAGTDFSADSKYAIITAARMFPDAQVHVVHAWHVPFEGFQRDSYVAEEVEAHEQKAMETFMTALAEAEPSLSNATSALGRGGTHKTITREFEKRCDLASEGLVVLGSHGQSGFRQATLGSVTSDLLRSLKPDILVINTDNATS
nr:universal stress protein [Altererythrobacter lutimaris]